MAPLTRSLLRTVIFSSLLSLSLADTCQYIRAAGGDGCWSLAQKCGISQDDLKSYNPVTDFCNNIKADQVICCSAGDLPDFSPKPSSNGTCFTYTVNHDDTCDSIATANKMDKAKIPGYNNETWGWAGCSSMQLGQRICLSEGTPPFPAPMEDAKCGPQVPGTVQPTDMAPSNWTNLNPCPLNACCDIWGQCGITPEFCTESPADTGAPGTAQNNTNGCISNCGSNIVNNDEVVTNPKRIGYFEAWNMNRKCMHMDISKLAHNGYYSHIHWAFANVTTDFQVDVSGEQDQFDGLKKLTLPFKILSFGGWGFSTAPYTYTVLRNGVKDGNRQVFAQNVVDFIVENDLDGVDFDWEYPGAQDIPGVPADDKDSGSNYLEFLKLVREKLPADKTLSIAAPSSYWYLKNFPIKEISDVVDYIVYMTYDLHGQWDYDKPHSDEGCPSGGCLRSQVNKTETQFALSMITKAGVPAKKVVAGLPLYGRSFKMVDPSCTGPMCHFTGPESGAIPGVCTDTAGYISNYEIFQYLNQVDNPEFYGNISVTQYEDQGDVLIIDGDNWISWLSPHSYELRKQWTDSLGFGGTSDWAIDLNQTYTNNGTGNEVDLYDDFELCDYTMTYGSLDDLSSAADGMRADCLAFYTMQVLIDMLDKAYDNYTNVNDGYDELFGYYVTYMNDLVPQILETELMLVGSGDEGISTPAGITFGPGMAYFDCHFSNGDHYPCGEYNDKKNHFGEVGSTDPTQLTLTDEDGWNAKLTDEGLSSDYVTFGDYLRKQMYHSPRGTITPFEYKFSGFPIKNESMVVPNPKEIVQQAIPSFPDLRTSMQATQLDFMLGQWYNGSMLDAAEAYSSPVFMLLQGVDGMATAKKIGQEEKEAEEKAAEQKKKDFILTIVSAVLIFVPFVGEEAAVAAGLTTLARSIAIAGEAGNAGLAIYDTVQDPKSAFVNIVGSLLGIGSVAKAVRDGPGLGAVAKIRQGMKATEIASLGKIFKSKSDVLDIIMKACAR